MSSLYTIARKSARKAIKHFYNSLKNNVIDKCIGIPPVCRGSRWISLGTRVSGTRSQSCTAVALETVKCHPEKRNSPPFRYPEERACRIARPFIYIFTIIER